MKNIKLIFASFFLAFLFSYNISAQTADEKFFAQVDHFRYLLKEDKKAVKAIYETQLIEADDYYGYEIGQATDESEKKRWEEAYEKTRTIIYKIYQEELTNLQNAFDKALQQLEHKYKESKSTSSRSKTKRG